MSERPAPTRRDEDPGVPSAVYVYRNVAGRAIAERGVWKREAVDDDLPLVEWKWRRAGEPGWFGIGPMQPTDLPLFGSELLRSASADAVVLFVDDDETAEAAQEAGLLAVSPPPGWRRGDVRRQLEMLQGRDVLLAPTSDDAGLEDARAIGAALDGLAARTRIAAVGGAERPDALAEMFRSGLRLAAIEDAVVEAEAVRRQRRKEVFGLRKASEIRPRQQEWLWKGYVPVGGLTMFDGDPGKGKSSIAWDMAARVTRGWAMPDGSPGIGRPRDVVIMASEDSLETTTVPRLMAAGANLDRVTFLTGVPTADGAGEPIEIPRDADYIATVVSECDAALLVFESLVEVLGDETNAYSDHRVRRALAPVRELAERLNIAVLSVRHLNKGQGKALYRGGGSIAFIALARAGLLAGDDPSDASGERRVLAVTKNNLAKRASSLAYHIEGANVPGPGGTVIATQRVAWAGACELRADDVLGAVAGTPQKPEMERAVEFLSEQLSRGAVASVELLELGEEEGITEGTLRRAAKRLGVDFRRVGFGAGSRVMWELRERPEARTLRTSPSV